MRYARPTLIVLDACGHDEDVIPFVRHAANLGVAVLATSPSVAQQERYLDAGARACTTSPTEFEALAGDRAP